MNIYDISKYENTNVFINRKEQETQEKLISNDEYINWLNDFTEEYSSFSTDDWIYDKTKLAHKDIINVSNMHLFYKAIEKYAVNNYINPIQTKYGILYQIKYNNIGHILGVDFSRGVVYCYRTNPNEKYIDFEDVLNNKKQENTEIYDKKLNGLDKHLFMLYDEGIPVNFIESHVSKVLKKIKEK